MNNDEISGKLIRFVLDEKNETVLKIAHIIKNSWFSFERGREGEK
jgi:hypothetical protein